MKHGTPPAIEVGLGTCWRSGANLPLTSCRAWLWRCRTPSNSSHTAERVHPPPPHTAVWVVNLFIAPALPDVAVGPDAFRDCDVEEAASCMTICLLHSLCTKPRSGGLVCTRDHLQWSYGLKKSCPMGIFSMSLIFFKKKLVTLSFQVKHFAVVFASSFQILGIFFAHLDLFLLDMHHRPGEERSATSLGPAHSLCCLIPDRLFYPCPPTQEVVSPRGCCPPRVYAGGRGLGQCCGRPPARVPCILRPGWHIGRS